MFYLFTFIREVGLSQNHPLDNSTHFIRKAKCIPLLVSFTAPRNTSSEKRSLFLAHSFTEFSMSLAGSAVLNLCRDGTSRWREHVIKVADHLRCNKRKLKGLGQSVFFRDIPQATSYLLNPLSFSSFSYKLLNDLVH